MSAMSSQGSCSSTNIIHQSTSAAPSSLKDVVVKEEKHEEIEEKESRKPPEDLSDELCTLIRTLIWPDGASLSFLELEIAPYFLGLRRKDGEIFRDALAGRSRIRAHLNYLGAMRLGEEKYFLLNSVKPSDEAVNEVKETALRRIKENSLVLESRTRSRRELPATVRPTKKSRRAIIAEAEAQYRQSLMQPPTQLGVQESGGNYTTFEAGDQQEEGAVWIEANVGDVVQCDEQQVAKETEGSGGREEGEGEEAAAGDEGPDEEGGEEEKEEEEEEKEEEEEEKEEEEEDEHVEGEDNEEGGEDDSEEEEEGNEEVDENVEESEGKSEKKNDTNPLNVLLRHAFKQRHGSATIHELVEDLQPYFNGVASRSAGDAKQLARLLRWPLLRLGATPFAHKWHFRSKVPAPSEELVAKVRADARQRLGSNAVVIVLDDDTKSRSEKQEAGLKKLKRHKQTTKLAKEARAAKKNRSAPTSPPSVVEVLSSDEERLLQSFSGSRLCGDADTQAYPVVTEAAATKPAAQPNLRLMITDEAELQANPSFKRFHLITLTERTIQGLSQSVATKFGKPLQQVGPLSVIDEELKALLAIDDDSQVEALEDTTKIAVRFRK